MVKTFAILISTKNRKKDLAYTLSQIKDLTDRVDVECIITDDGSTDGTSAFIRTNYPSVILHTNTKSMGYLYCRNTMLNATQSSYAISLDDDAHFITSNPLEIIEAAFIKYPEAGVMGFRIIWTTNTQFNTKSHENMLQMQSFVGCAHAWRMTAWHSIPNYPEWFRFYGEENFAAYHLYQSKMSVMYLPDVLVQHRVDLKARKLQFDYKIRLRRSLFSGWSLMGLFYPLRLLPRRMVYSIWIQLKLKVFKGDLVALKVLLLAFWDLILALPKIIPERRGFKLKDFKNFEQLEPAKIFWKEEGRI